MNLSKMLDEGAATKPAKTASLTDLRWFQEGLVSPGHPNFTPTGEVGTQDNNTKPALEVEWGTGDIAPLFSEQQADVVQRNLDPTQPVDAHRVIIFARDQMNRGVMGHQLIASLRKRFPPASLAAARDGLRQQFTLEGLVGCIAVDGRGYASCKDALKAASHSPFKRFIKHVIGCECGTPHMLPNSHVASLKTSQTTGNATDDFFASDNSQEEKVAHCQSTMMPILARGDLDDSEMDETMIDLMNVTELPQNVVNEVKASKVSNVRKVQMAFRRLVSLRDQLEAQQYQGKVDTAGFVIDTEERPVELISQKQEELKVDGTNPALAQEVTIDKAARTNFDGIRTLKARGPFVPLDRKAQEQVDVELTDETHTAELTISSAKKPLAALKINAKAAPVVADIIEFGSPEIDLTQVLDPEFAGTDEIDLDDEAVTPDDIDVDLKQDMIV